MSDSSGNSSGSTGSTRDLISGIYDSSDGHPGGQDIVSLSLKSWRTSSEHQQSDTTPDMFTNRPSGGGGEGGGGGSRRQEQRGHHKGASIGDVCRGASVDTSSRGGNEGGCIDHSRGGSIGGGSVDSSVSNRRPSRNAVQTKPSTAQPVARPTPMARQATAAALAPASVAVAPATPSTTAAARRAPPSFSAAPASGSVLPAAQPFRRGGVPVVVNEPEVYLCTDEYPFTSEQFDRERELLLAPDPNAPIDEKVPLMDRDSHKQLNLTVAKGNNLEEWDLECARKHLDAIKDSVTTHEQLHEFTLMEGEEPAMELNLAGLENAPGLFNDVTQQCRVAFTNKNRLIFTQANHSAEVGQPTLPFLASVLSCFQERWSRRKWTAYYAAINSSEVLQVFVQQTLCTSYQTSKCSCKDVYDIFCCPAGGTMYSQKDMNGVTQTLGDHDPNSCMSRWDKTRYMRHALVIRYADCASNAVLETTAMALPSTPAAKLYEMARLINATITMTMADWLKHKMVPTPLASTPFQNAPPSPPLFQRTSYKVLLFVLLAVALGFLALNVTAAVFMILAIFIALGGSYSSMRTPHKTAARAVGLASKTLLGTQGVGLGVYAIAFAVVVSSIGGGDEDETGYTYPR
eukprot:g16095.t2